MTRNDWTDEEPETDPQPPQSEKPFQLRANPPRVMRLSRKALAIAGGTTALGLGVILIIALQPRSKDEETSELYATGRTTPAPGVSSLPRDYTGIPKLGPPLPGEFGKPVLRRAQDSGDPLPDGSFPPTRPGNGSPVTGQLTQPTPAQTERAAARTSALFISRGVSTPQPPPTVDELSATRASAAPEAPAAQRDRFVNVDGRTTSATVSMQTLQAGTVIPAALITGIQSDLPGLVVAQVTEPVRDSLTGSRILIPQGARLIGTYDTELAAGQTRLLLAWNRLLLPDGRSIDLDRMPATDPSGEAGLSDRVDNHWGSVLKAALVSTLIGIGAQSSSTGDESDIARAIRDGASDSVARTGRQLVERELARQPTITISPGFRLRVLVTEDIQVPA
jgi:type IV secretion system protein VirB10